MDVLFFVFFQATVRALAADPTDTAALKPVLGLRAGDDLEHLGCLEFVVGVEFGAKIGWRNTMLFLFLSLFSYFFPLKKQLEESSAYFFWGGLYYPV